MLSLTHDPFNYLFSYCELEELKIVFTGSRNCLSITNTYATSIIKKLGGEEDEKRNSFSRLYHLQGLINLWTKFERHHPHVTTEGVQLFCKFQYALELKRMDLFKLYCVDSKIISIKDIFHAINLEFSYLYKEISLFNKFKKRLTVFPSLQLIAYCTSPCFEKHPANNINDLNLFFQGIDAMLFALSRGDKEKLKSLLENNFRQLIENDYANFETLLISSLANCDIELFELLVQSLKNSTSNFDQLKLKKFGIILESEKSKKYENFATLWLLYSKDILKWTERNLAKIATVDNNIPLLEALKSISFDFNVIDCNQTAPLHLVTTAEAAKVLVSGGADLNAKTWANRTPLRIAIENKNESLAHYFLSQGACIDYVGEFDGLQSVTSKKNMTNLKSLISKISFISLLKIGVNAKSFASKWLVIKEIAYRARYIILAAIIIPAIYAAAIMIL